MIRRLAVALLLVAPVLAAQKPAPPAPLSPLAPYAGTKVAVVPVQFYRADTTGWGAPAGLALRAAFDSLLSEALNEHGLSGLWATPADVQRSAKRNAMYIGDPRNLSAFSVRYGAKPDAQIADPFAGNIRRIVALHDARYALIPIEIRVERGPGGGFLVCRLLLMDARVNVPLWQGDLVGEVATAYAPRLLERLATRLADLVVAP